MRVTSYHKTEIVRHCHREHKFRPSTARLQPWQGLPEGEGTPAGEQARMGQMRLAGPQMRLESDQALHQRPQRSSLALQART